MEVMKKLEHKLEVYPLARPFCDLADIMRFVEVNKGVKVYGRGWISKGNLQGSVSVSYLLFAGESRF